MFSILGGTYLYVTGIPGESRDVDHLNWIDLYGYTLHIENGSEPKADPCPKFSGLLIAKKMGPRYRTADAQGL